MARLFFPILAFLLLLSQASAAETDENDLFRAAEEGDVGGIRQCLASGCSINVKDHAQMTPLHHAAMAKKPEVIRLLIERGADVNARDRYGMTPLLYSGMDPEIMRPLLEGAPTSTPASPEAVRSCRTPSSKTGRKLRKFWSSTAPTSPCLTASRPSNSWTRSPA